MATQPPERTQRYTQARRQGINANRRAAAGGAKYGTSYAAQGYRPEKEAGQAFLNRQEAAVRGGPFNPLSWLQKGYGSSLMLKARPNQTGRIAEGGGEWRPASEVLSPGHYAAYLRTTEGQKGQARQRWIAAHPEAASQPGGGMDAWLYNKYTSRLPVDPETGLKVNPSGELYDPNVMAGGPVGRAGVGVDPYSGFNIGGRGGRLGAGKAAAGSLRASSTPGAGGDLEGALTSGLQDLLSAQGPFTPEVIQNLRNQAKMDAYGGLAQEKRAINEDAISRGIFRSGIPSDVSRVAEEAAASRYSGATQNIGTQAVLQNHQARLQALDRAQQWLNSKRQWILANETNALNRELGLKQIGLGYARIQAEQSALEKQLAQSNYQFNQLNPNLEFTDPNTGQNISLAPGTLRYLDYFMG